MRPLRLVTGLLAGALWMTTAAAADSPVPQRAGPEAIDRLQLDSTAVTGNRELPRVMSIVPWKPPEPPTGPERPMGSLIDELLSPVDREEFRREITYYRGMTPQSTPNEAQVAGRPVAAVLPDPGQPVPTGPTGASKP